MAKNKLGGMRNRRIAGDIVTYVFLVIVCAIWLIPFFWLVMQSFRDGKGQFISTFLPTKYTLNNYKALFTEFDVMNFPRMFLNTFGIACCTCVISTFFVLSVSYCTSRLKWKMRKPYMNMAMILNLFPGFMTMVAVYFILKALGMTEGNKIPLALIICFSSGAGTQFYVMKGFMDTIPKALDEAAAIDGCGPVKILYKIIAPMLSPSLVACGLFQFMWSCNDYMGPLLYVQTPSKYPMSIFVKLSMDADAGFSWNRILALSLISIIPQLIVFFCAQDAFIDGISAGAVKG